MHIASVSQIRNAIGPALFDADDSLGELTRVRPPENWRPIQLLDWDTIVDDWLGPVQEQRRPPGLRGEQIQLGPPILPSLLP